MKKPEVGKLLLLASGFDRRVVDELTVSSWFSVPAIQAANYDDAAQAVIAHQTGPSKDKYLTVGLVCEYITGLNRQSAEAIAADVRSARSRKLIDKEWDERQPLPADVLGKLTQARALENEERSKWDFDSNAISYRSDLGSAQVVGLNVDFGEVGRQA